MTDKNVFYSLVRHIRKEDIDVELKYLDENIAAINGMAGADSMIIMVMEKISARNVNWKRATSLLIHEYGHVLLFLEDKDKHSEKKAWEFGLQNIPKKYIPDSINEDMNFYLKTYNYKRHFKWDQDLEKLS